MTTATNPQQEAILIFLASAILDSWTLTYGAISDLQVTLGKEGFTLIRFPTDLHLFGPDTLHVKLPPTYSWQEIKDNLNLCDLCDKHSPTTQRYSYSGRACPSCAIRQPLPDSKD